MSELVSLKVERVRDLIAELRADLEPASDRQFLEELCADATGWEMAEAMKPIGGSQS